MHDLARARGRRSGAPIRTWFLCLLFVLLPGMAVAADWLASWQAGPARERIVRFVEDVTDPTRPHYVPPAERIAVFDNDGTLWSEQPVYFQLQFAFDRVRELAPKHPEWQTTEPFRSVLAGDQAGIAAAGEQGLAQIVAATHSGTSSDEFERIVARWLDTARHPRFQRRYDELTFAPMRELLVYLRAHGFKTFIVSGGGNDFMRVFSQRAYGIPPEQVIGSRLRSRYEVRDGRPEVVRLPEIGFIDDGPGKPVGIEEVIGRRPILAVGNSDGDFEMLEYTTGAPGPRLGVIVHHDDGAREYAYDRASPFGHLERALDAAPGRGWLVVSMKDDWRTIY